ncbi:transglutaminase family protein [Luteolibacter ambystomatis]|uniref:Transglutaminase family protein n=1 Tax=Luteolibacter ambystomatis TaxID=2824561 RepID=A0A975J200_9BACT|nr:transglutaminase family protein [Luteolibacter ambystomatis]QUE52565.1 transglutaminase family protein [Luteolibacter ambystomatis]
MHYRIIHRTRYVYEGAVTVSHHLAHLAPRPLPTQRCPWHDLQIIPQPVGRSVRSDAFGNVTTYFEIEGSHTVLEVVACSLVEVKPSKLPDLDKTPSWESIRDACQAQSLTPASAAGEFRFSSPMVPVARDFAEYAKNDFTPGKPILAAVRDLTKRIHREFKFDTRATDVATPVHKVLERKAGVCQDFAHLMLACLRSLALPARYVSGYLETDPPPGRERLIGADASHAWVSVFCGDDHGWIDADPTNGIFPEQRHITVAWGRDFADVSPLRGVTLGAGDQRLFVGVDVLPVDE